jgi:cell division protein FtsW
VKRPRGSHLEYHLLVLVTLGLVAFGLVMVYSASSARALLSSDAPSYYLKRQAIYAVIGLVALVILSRLDFHRLRHATQPLLAVTFVLLVAVLAIGTAVNGARRWIPIGFMNFQPSELAKLVLALWTAALLARRPAPRTLGELAKPIGVVVGLACALILIEPDLGTAIAIAIMVSAILVVSGTRLRLLASAAGITTGIVLLAIWFEPYRRERIFSFLDPWHDPQGAGFQAVQSMIALGSGGFFGVGLGESVQKVYYLPEASTDMIFAIVGEELGLLGTLVVMVLFIVLGFAGIRVAMRTREPFVRYTAAGITMWLLIQAIINIGMVLGLMPVIGIPLPLISYGGSSLLVNLVALGILINCAKTEPGAKRALEAGKATRKRAAAPARVRVAGRR